MRRTIRCVATILAIIAALTGAGFQRIAPRAATEEELARVHDPRVPDGVPECREGLRPVAASHHERHV